MNGFIPVHLKTPNRPGNPVFYLNVEAVAYFTDAPGGGTRVYLNVAHPDGGLHYLDIKHSPADFQKELEQMNYDPTF